MQARTEGPTPLWVGTGSASLDQVLRTTLAAHGFCPLDGGPAPADLYLIHPASLPAAAIEALRALNAGAADGRGGAVIVVEIDAGHAASAAWPPALTDDVLRMPVDALELGRRALGVLRARRWAREGLPPRLRIGNLTLDHVRRQLAIGGRSVVLGAPETALLLRLACQPGVLVRVDALRSAVAGEAQGTTDAGAPALSNLSRLVARTRRALTDAGADGVAIVSEYDLGYRLTGPSDPA